jgi:hypothetical protein
MVCRAGGGSFYDPGNSLSVSALFCSDSWPEDTKSGISWWNGIRTTCGCRGPDIAALQRANTSAKCTCCTTYTLTTGKYVREVHLLYYIYYIEARPLDRLSLGLYDYVLYHGHGSKEGRAHSHCVAKAMGE